MRASEVTVKASFNFNVLGVLRGLPTRATLSDPRGSKSRPYSTQKRGVLQEASDQSKDLHQTDDDIGHPSTPW